jgi:hypothetical protein
MTDEAPCKKCGGLNGVHYLTCPTLRYTGDLKNDPEHEVV